MAGQEVLGFMTRQGPERPGDADAVVPMTAKGLEPLFAFYKKGCAALAQEMLSRGERKVLALLAGVTMRVVGYGEIERLEGADLTFINVNTERELEKAAMKSRLSAERSRSSAANGRRSTSKEMP